MAPTDQSRLLEKGKIVKETIAIYEVTDEGSHTCSFFFHLVTLFIFTKSDFKTVIVPQLVFALATFFTGSTLTEVTIDPSFETVLYRLPLAFIWLWTNLLVENLANQRLPKSIIEDQTNKPWRAIPSGRITPTQTHRLLLALIPVNLAVSALLGGFLPSVTLMTLVWMYNDLEGSGIDIWVRNLLNGGGLMCFSWGSLRVLAGAELKPAAYIWILATGLIIVTTVHAQDFPDVEGDREAGRSTVPLLYGETPARLSMAIGVLAWSVGCPALWLATPVGYIAPVLVSGTMAVLTLTCRTVATDEIVWKLWCLWITVLYLTPLFGTR